MGKKKVLTSFFGIPPPLLNRVNVARIRYLFVTYKTRFPTFVRTRDNSSRLIRSTLVDDLWGATTAFFVVALCVREMLLCAFFFLLFIRAHQRRGSPIYLFFFSFADTAAQRRQWYVVLPRREERGRRLERYENVAAAIMERNLQSEMD